MTALAEQWGCAGMQKWPHYGAQSSLLPISILTAPQSVRGTFARMRIRHLAMQDASCKLATLQLPTRESTLQASRHVTIVSQDDILAASPFPLNPIPLLDRFSAFCKTPVGFRSPIIRHPAPHTCCQAMAHDSSP